MHGDMGARWTDCHASQRVDQPMTKSEIWEPGKFGVMALRWRCHIAILVRTELQLSARTGSRCQGVTGIAAHLRRGQSSSAMVVTMPRQLHAAPHRSLGLLKPWRSAHAVIRRSAMPTPPALQQPSGRQLLSVTAKAKTQSTKAGSAVTSVAQNDSAQLPQAISYAVTASAVYAGIMFLAVRWNSVALQQLHHCISHMQTHADSRALSLLIVQMILLPRVAAVRKGMQSYWLFAPLAIVYFVLMAYAWTPDTLSTLMPGNLAAGLSGMCGTLTAQTDCDCTDCDCTESQPPRGMTA